LEPSKEHSESWVAPALGAELTKVADGEESLPIFTFRWRYRIADAVLGRGFPLCSLGAGPRPGGAERLPSSVAAAATRKGPRKTS
jgi:hypothetical protein